MLNSHFIIRIGDRDKQQLTNLGACALAFSLALLFLWPFNAFLKNLKFNRLHLHLPYHLSFPSVSVSQHRYQNNVALGKVLMLPKHFQHTDIKLFSLFSIKKVNYLIIISINCSCSLVFLTSFLISAFVIHHAPLSIPCWLMIFLCLSSDLPQLTKESRK